MKVDFRGLRAFGAALLMGVVTGATGCGDDPAPAPPAPRYAPITVFNALTDIGNANVQFKIGETILTQSATYGVPVVVPSALVGTSTEVKSLASAGAALGSSNVHIDTNRSIWVIVSGEALSQKSAVFGVSDVEPTVPAGAILIRAIHASNNAPKLDVRQDNALGPKLASGIDYKGHGDFTSISAAATKISITRVDTGVEILEHLITTPLVAGKIYNLVIYGSADAGAAPESKLTSKLLMEPS